MRTDRTPFDSDRDRPSAPVSRRGVMRMGTALGAMGLLATAAPASAAGDAPGKEPALRKPILVGANPGLQLFDPSGACTAYISTWQVDWSTHGAGNAVVLWRPDGVRAVGEDPHLTLWLADRFVRHFPELEGLPWSAPRFHRSAVRIRLDLASGLHAWGGGIDVRMAEVLDRRAFATDRFPLGSVEHSLSLVIGPCGRARATVDGHTLPGEISRGGTPDRPSSSAFVATAEVWRA
ncbi:hypothetical protein [Streptomyces roseicoloratus]|uniref:Tat pathway signal sequence domain protein n=1 Tax=Streptomyces roseicoloratus TaxID=2508722 RepID=A0ABY9RPY0_9ACTN|nr:hypothetical protein [Streptomyces roseicoloratus]WMX44253.1 hypothetical protein RGF97_04425 [Streptomyces roseicoloratus]